MSIDHNLAGNTPRPTLVPASIGRGLSQLVPSFARGRLRLLLPNGSCVVSGIGALGPDVAIEIKRWRALWRLALDGEVGFARSYIDGDWSTANLGQLFQLAMINEEVLSRSLKPSWPMRVLQRFRHFTNRNTMSGSRRNILAHYDLGNSFYESWLDRGMNYSSALYRDCDSSLEAAQAAKLDRVIELLLPKPNGQVLEIGCGWGSLAERLVQMGSRVTAVTLSPAQLSYVRRKLSGAIAAGDLNARLLDYREIAGRFDNIVSIEMIEAVGEAYWPTYFAILRDKLRDGGAIVMQAITICESRFKAYRAQPDFIQQFIFPGGMLPTASLIRQHAERAGLRLTAQEHFGESYAMTLAEWRRRFHDAWPSLAKAGFDERFHRLWDYYFAYCEMGFRFKSTDVGLFKFEHASR